MHVHDEIQNFIIMSPDADDYFLCLSKRRRAVESDTVLFGAAFEKSVTVLRYRRLEDFA
jgi:hypothetical protein